MADIAEEAVSADTRDATVCGRFVYTVFRANETAAFRMEDLDFMKLRIPITKQSLLNDGVIKSKTSQKGR